MRKNKSSLSKAASYKEMGDFWDSHDLSDYWDKTEEVDIEVRIESEKTLYEIEKKLSLKVQKIARKHKISPRGLVNRWVREKLREETQAVSKKH